MLEPSPVEKAAPLPERRRGPGILLNSATNILGQGGLAIVGAITGLLTARALGPEGVGVLGVTFILADFGRPLSSFTHVPSILHYHRGRDAEVVFDTSLAIKLVLSTVFSLTLLVASPFLEATFALPQWSVLLATMVVLVGSFYEVGAARLEAENKMVRSNVILVVGAIVGLVGVVALYLTDSLTVYTSIVTTILANAAMSIGALLRAHKPIFRRIEIALGLDMASYGIRILATALLTQGLLQTNTLLISHLRGNAAAGVYTIVFNLTFVMVTASAAMGVALLAALSQLAGRGEDTGMGYQRGTIIALGVGLGLGAAYVIFGRFILAFYGESFLDGYPALLILTLFGLAAALAVPAAAMLNVHGRAGTQTLISLSQLALNVPLSILLINLWGLTGAAVATTSLFLVGTVASWVIVKRVTGHWPFSRAAFGEAVAHARARLGLRRA